MSVWLFSRLTSSGQHNNTYITSMIEHLWFISSVSGSVSVPSVTVVAVASWVREICKFSASHLSLKHSSATRTEEARPATAVMATRPLSRKRLERPPQDREKRQRKSDTPAIWRCWPGAGKRTFDECNYFSPLSVHLRSMLPLASKWKKKPQRRNSQTLGA